MLYNNSHSVSQLSSPPNKNCALLCLNRLQSLREKTQRRERDSTSDEDEDEEESEDEELEAYENDAPFPMVRAQGALTSG